MSFVIAAPEMVTAAATDQASIGSTISAANAAAVAPPIFSALPAVTAVTPGLAHRWAALAPGAPAGCFRATTAERALLGWWRKELARCRF